MKDSIMANAETYIGNTPLNHQEKPILKAQENGIFDQIIHLLLMYHEDQLTELMMYPQHATAFEQKISAHIKENNIFLLDLSILDTFVQHLEEILTQAKREELVSIERKDGILDVLLNDVPNIMDELEKRPVFLRQFNDVIDDYVRAPDFDVDTMMPELKSAARICLIDALEADAQKRPQELSLPERNGLSWDKYKQVTKTTLQLAQNAWTENTDWNFDPNHIARLASIMPIVNGRIPVPSVTSPQQARTKYSRNKPPKYTNFSTKTVRISDQDWDQLVDLGDNAINKWTRNAYVLVAKDGQQDDNAIAYAIYQNLQTIIQPDKPAKPTIMQNSDMQAAPRSSEATVNIGIQKQRHKPNFLQKTQRRVTKAFNTAAKIVIGTACVASFLMVATVGTAVVSKTVHERSNYLNPTATAIAHPYATPRTAADTGPNILYP